MTAAPSLSAGMLPRSDPAANGVDPAAIQAFVDAAEAERLQLHSLMIVRHGHVLAEAWWDPYRADLPHTAFSLSKSFTATAVGLAAQESLLSVDEPLLDIFPGYAAGRPQREVASLTLRHLLTMSTGHTTDSMAVMRLLPGYDWVRIFLDVPFTYQPGEYFCYDSGASYVLSAAVQARAGQPLDQYLRPRIFEPLGITAPPWAASPSGVSLGASGLRLRTEDIAKLGLLYLHGGQYGGRRLLTEQWVAQATAGQVATHNAAADWAQGYGYQFWRSTHDSYRADGAYGQFSFVLPGLDTVIAVTAGNRENWRIPPVVWDHLLPGIHPDSTPLGVGTGQLTARLSTLRLEVPRFLSQPPAWEAELASRRIRVEHNPFGISALRLLPQTAQIALEYTAPDGSTEMAVAGRDTWLPGSTSLWPYDEPSGPEIASAAGWTAEDTLEVHQQVIGGAFRRTWQFTFRPGGEVAIRIYLDMPYWVDRADYLAGRLESA